jgi:CheY-like chemotaxis protein
VLYVDDSPANRFLMEWTAARENAGFRLLTASGMKGAIKYLESKRKAAPALLITDYVLEDFCAPDLLRWLDAQSLWAHLPTVVLSSGDDPLSIASSYAAGAQSFLRKPRTHGEWPEMVRTIGLCVASTGVTLEPLKALSCYRGCRVFELRTQLEHRGQHNAMLRAERAQLLAALDIARAEAKESKRKYPYPGKRSSGPDGKA